MPAFQFQIIDGPRGGEIVTLECASLSEYWQAVDDEVQITLPDGARARRSTPPAGPAVRRRAKWPLHSEAMAVDPRDRHAAEANCRQAGIPTEYDPLGRPVLTGPDHRRKLLALDGLVDRRSYY